MVERSLCMREVRGSMPGSPKLDPVIKWLPLSQDNLLHIEIPNK